MFGCVICQYRNRRAFAVCPSCKAAETCAPVVVEALKRPRLSEIDRTPIERIDCGTDWNTALGGGVTKGGVVLVASRGGSGKTTEMLRVAGRIGTKLKPSIYFFSERTDSELAGQADLIGANMDHIVTIGPIASVDEILEQAPTDANIFLDSIGYLDRFDPKVDVERLREMGIASAWLICHVNKRGDIEGREKLTHAATAVVWVRKRSLRTSKNWFGPQGIVVDRELPPAFAKPPTPPRKLRVVKTG